jgi:hypothetical protein
MGTWEYIKSKDNSSRFVLGEIGKGPLICIGVNPSTAEPEELDKTSIVIKALAYNNDFDGWIMINLYPQRETDISKLHSILDVELHKKNLEVITSILEEYNLDNFVDKQHFILEIVE